ncbi:hypothetical protein [Streptomyces sp. DH24]|uniref:hypothetical protein n=1 Tax=Streptomyces sp. DH24 TaxID=3040123 RepID=UPI0024414AA4|nr:hypothetical protein [Streptomyces sp. DH24]MDG9715414.1 hypothetical protein [Streptomyces sp. DH24]
MPDRVLRISACAYDRLAALAAADGLRVRELVERLARELPVVESGERAGFEGMVDLRLALLGVDGRAPS